MPPNVALLFSLLFICTILWIESKRNVQVSMAIWIPLFWFMIAASRPLSTWLNPQDMYIGVSDVESGNPVDRTFFSALIVVALYVLARREIAWNQVVKRNAWLFGLFIIAGLSVIWSDLPMVSFKRWVRSLGAVLSVMIVLTESDPIEASKRLFRRCAYVLIPLSVLFVKYFRHLGVGWDYFGRTMWYGVATHKNSLGQLACVSATFLFWSLFEGRKNRNLLWWIDLVVLVMSLWLLRGSGTASSKTAILLFFIGLFVYFGLKVLKNYPFNAGKMVSCMLLFFILFEFIIYIITDQSIFAMVISASGRDQTLTGRTFLWEELIKMASPFLGAGFGAFWTSDNISILWRSFDWGPESAHNGFLDVYLDLGFVGIVFLIGFIAQAYRNLMNRLMIDYSYGVFQVILFFMSIIYNFTESSLLRPSSLLWIALLLITVNIRSLKEA